LQDFLCYYAVGEATRRGLPVQIHTGILEGFRNYHPAHTSPTLLVPLIAAYPEARFDLFHAGFPYARELSVMAMEFPNVWVDLCWVPLISETAAVQILEEWIDMLPGNKLLWGSDCISPVTTLGAAIFGRRVVVEAVARRAEAGAFGEKQARRLVEGILRENAQALFYGG
jgi:predicted TIM-barrel fold metal-dependent hydrolase